MLPSLGVHPDPDPSDDLPALVVDDVGGAVGDGVAGMGDGVVGGTGTGVVGGTGTVGDPVGACVLPDL